MVEIRNRYKTEGIGLQENKYLFIAFGNLQLAILLVVFLLRKSFCQKIFISIDTTNFSTSSYLFFVESWTK